MPAGVEITLTNEEIEQQIEQLDSSLPKDEGKIFIEALGPRGCEVIGNRNGYLRLGIELLKTAVVPLQPGALFTSTTIDYLIQEERSQRVLRFSRTEDVEAAIPPLPLKTESWRTKFAAIGCLVIFLFLAVCILVGLAQIFGWFLG